VLNGGQRSMSSSAGLFLTDLGWRRLAMEELGHVRGTGPSLGKTMADSRYGSPGCRSRGGRHLRLTPSGDRSPSPTTHRPVHPPPCIVRPGSVDSGLDAIASAANRFTVRIDRANAPRRSVPARLHIWRDPETGRRRVHRSGGATAGT